jgi:thioredoxin
MAYPLRLTGLLPLVLLLSSCDKLREAAQSNHVSQLDAEAYDAFTMQRGKVMVVDFYADWCGPCRKLAPILDQIAADNGGLVLVGKVNVEDHRELATKEGIRSIPEVRIFRDGRQVDRFVGLPRDAEVRHRIEVHTKGLSAAAPGEEPVESPQPSITPATKDWLPPGIERR